MAAQQQRSSSAPPAGWRSTPPRAPPPACTDGDDDAADAPPEWAPSSPGAGGASTSEAAQPASGAQEESVEKVVSPTKSQKVSIAYSDGYVQDDSDPGSPCDSAFVNNEGNRRPSVLLDRGWQRDSDMVDASTNRSSVKRAMSLHTANLRFAQEVEKVTHLHAAAHGEDDGRFAFLNRLVMSPMSRMNIFWDAMFAFFVLYDFIKIPLELLNPPSTGLSKVMTWCSRVFWTLAIPKHFITGHVMHSGHTEMRFTKIALHYMKTFFAFDVIIIWTDWMELVLDEVKNVSSVKAIKIVRVLRLLRVVRLAKVTKAPDFIMKVFAYLFSERFLLIMDIVKVTVFLAFLVHYAACGWYALGAYLRSSCDTWVEKYEVTSDDAAVFERWATSAHWAVANFMGASDIYPQNQYERVVAAASLLCSFVISACLQARITASMSRLHHLGGNHDIRLASLRQFLNNRGISPDLSVRVMTCATHVMQTNGLNMSETEIDLFPHINEDLQTEIHAELYAPVLLQHPFFRAMHRVDYVALTRICHLAVNMRNLVTGDRLFSQGEVASPPQLYFIVSGTFLYAKDAWLTEDDLQYVNAKQWAGEPSLYVQRWSYVGGLRALTNARSLIVNGLQLCRLAREETQTSFALSYAQAFVEQLEDAFSEGHKVDDLYPGFDVVDVARVVLVREFPEMKVYRTYSVSSTKAFQREKSWNPFAREQGD